jgi:rubrerythrin
MSREKQIEEMAEYIFGNAITHDTQFKEDCRSIAIDLYNAGYRKQKDGRWKGAGLGDYYCSLCCSTYSGGDEYNYCPNCGAKMKGGAE